MKPFLLTLFSCIVLTQSPAQQKTDPWLEQLIRQQASPSLLQVLDQPDTFQYQLIYTQINRDKNNQPQLKNYYLHVDRDRYFNPASMVKLPTALLALEKIHSLKNYGVDMNTAMLTDSAYQRQTKVRYDSSSASYLPSVAHYVKKIFLVSDNDAYNRLYEFVGQETLNQRLWQMGYNDTRITRRFVTMTEDQNRHTNPIRFIKGKKLLYAQPGAYNPAPFDFSKKELVGKAHYNREDSLILSPMDFTTHNKFPLEDMQQILQSVIFPGSVPADKRFGLTDEDYRFLYRYMSELPSESDFPKYDTSEFFESYTKFFLFKAGKSKIPPHIRVFNKTGWSYGFLTDVAYIVDLKNNVEFMLSGVIYVNKDGILNDDKYEYEETGYPFFKEVGNIIYQHELKRKRSYKPDLEPFRIQYTDRQAWIRVNLLGYKPASTKVAVWGSKEQKTISTFELVDVSNGKTVYKGKAGDAFGAYGPFVQTYRLNFSSYNKPGRYVLKVGDIVSPEFSIGDDVYKGAADFALRYMRQQRSGFNPFLKDSCHTHDAYTMYGPMPDSTRIDVSGGWHDASDYLQYATTSANATWHLLAAYRDFPKVFGDKHQANGLEGANGKADVLDEAKWGLDWLLKMHPKEDWLFNQIADDRDHQGMRIPKEDNFYGRGYERPVYFCTGEPQGLFRYKNRATGVASTAGKFSSAFSLGALVMKEDTAYRSLLLKKAMSAFNLGISKPGVCQTAPGRAPYFYEEDNWVDDMELATAQLHLVSADAAKDGATLADAMKFANQEKTTPWLGADTARHYQWYPFVNPGHYELAKQLQGDKRDTIIGYYKSGIEKVWSKAKQNAFYRGVPFIWCSNNLTTSFAIQCFWYRELSNDAGYAELEQANFDWLFGCNPWGTSMVYGLPANGDTPVDPHSAFTHLENYPIDGGLVDGPVYGNIYKNLIGITLYEADEYAAFQSDLVVYHDDYGDYSTNEPTMDGTASLIYLLAAKEAGKTSPVKKN